MKLKKLILHGFKSFADKTEFEFRDGITVIVGPNGCGKSNVVDAFKWVLGEQRPTSLRGKEMQDVIFSGTDSRKGLGFAEVTIVLDNSSHTLPLDYEEVAITRRLYRSGESEYVINGNMVRLRDVRELMMDSGGGPGALTVMEQGNIDRLLRADPHERRLVFEEAAGIAKYRARRKEAQRKLERTADNLSRMRDILGEYETRQRSLKIQAGKARRFREMSEELKKKRLAGALARYADLARRRADALGQLHEIERLETDARGRLEEAVTGGEGRRKELDEQLEQVRRQEAEMAALVAEGRAATEKRAARDREAKELVERAENARREAGAAAARVAELAPGLEGARHEESEADAERGRRAEALAEVEAMCSEVAGRAALLREERDALDMRRTETFALETAARNDLLSAEAEKKALVHRLNRLEQRVKSSGEELAALNAAHEGKHMLVRKAEDDLRGLDDRATAAEAGARLEREKADAAAQDVAQHAGDAKDFAARREVLSKLAANGEGLSAGTRALLEAGLPGVLGTLADYIGDVGAEAAALDQALGDLAGGVVVETTQQAVEAVRWLKDGRRGRARLIPLDRVGTGTLPERFRDVDVPILGALLKGTCVVDSLDEALEVQEGRVVALSGEEIEACGAIVGGTGDAGAGLVQRRAELSDLDGRLEAAVTARDEAQALFATARERAAAWEVALEELRPRLRAARAIVREMSEHLAAAEKEAARRAEEMDVEHAEREDVVEQIAACEARAGEASVRREEAERTLDLFESEVIDLRERLARAGRDRDQSAALLTEAKVAAARWTEKAESAAARIAALEASITAAEREVRTRGDEAETCTVRRTDCLDEIGVLDQLAKERDHTMDRLAREVEAERRTARETREHMEAGDRHVRELRVAHERQREELERHRLRENELRLRVETLLEQVRRDEGLDLAAVDVPVAEGEALDPEALENEIAELQSKLERLGNVNHAALDELGEVETKLEFMRREETDLVTAERQLLETIETIDEVCTERFTSTFNEVAENFRVVFRKLFGGGKAEIFLENPEDVLQTGIEIRVRPPGKELRNMELLSGGEKSLTTVALLFAIYQSKPPPFCLLDEVDAALDEANTVRMCEMLKEFATKGQFLIITHARPTMTVADTLYGVTMPDAGVSRRVAVRFQDIEAGRIVGLN